MAKTKKEEVEMTKPMPLNLESIEEAPISKEGSSSFRSENP
jgi:hypothetical protein